MRMTTTATTMTATTTTTTTTTATTKMLDGSRRQARERRVVGISERNHWRWRTEELEPWSSFIIVLFVFDFVV